MDLQTILVYGGMLISSILLTSFAQKEENKRYLWITILIISIIAGLRANTVGIDTSNYVKHFQFLKLDRPDLVYGMENGFKYLCLFLLKIFKDEHFLFFIFAFITHGLIIFRLWDFKDKINLPVSVATYLVMFFPESLNVMRQLIAIAIVFYATRYIHNRNYKKFFSCIILAFFFHNSALIGLLFLCIDLYNEWNKYDHEKKKNIIKNSMIVFLCIFVALLFLIFNANIIARYEKYFTNINIRIGFMQFAKFIFLLCTIYLTKDDIKFSNSSEIKRMQIFYGLGIILTSMGYIFRGADRIGWYFSIVESGYFGVLYKSSKYQRFFQFIIILILVYTFLHKLSSGSNGEIPYLFMWQK